jgi:hypothetical protein
MKFYRSTENCRSSFSFFAQIGIHKGGQPIANPHSAERIHTSRVESRFGGEKLFMRRNWTPSIVPESGDQNI